MDRKFQTDLATQARCIGALVIRDLMQHYGRANIGFLWVVVEPLILATGVMLIWHFVKPASEHGVPILKIVFTAYLPLTLWRHLSNSGIRVFSSNIGLLYHRHVTLLDIVLARLTLETFGTTTAMLFSYSVLVAIGALDVPADPTWVLCGWLSMAVLGGGTSMIFSILTEYSETTERFIQPIQYLILPLSGAFFMVDWLPNFTQDLALLNPTVHCYEMFRAGILGDEYTTHFTAWYPGLFGLVLFAIGLYFLDSVRDSLRMS